ncbi:helix-turn-helix transcriptional regulator [Flindersiella endophytica]
MHPLTRITGATLDVLEVLLTWAAGDGDGAGGVWGLEIVKRTGRPTGSVYPILDRLERAGWLTSEWEDETVRRGARRRLYRLTAQGATEAARTLAERRPSRASPATKPLAAQ